MKALGYELPTRELTENSFAVFELPRPEASGEDLLVEVQAISINPVDYKQRQKRASVDGAPVILGWDACGIVRGLGDGVRGFQSGDVVFYAGELNRSGSNAEFQLVDYRLAARAPSGMSVAEAAAVPLTALTAWEALFEQLQVQHSESANILVIGGAGGVGSMAIQLLRALTEVEVFATAGRAESAVWASEMGAHTIVDRQSSLSEQRENGQLPEFDFIFSTTNSDRYHADFVRLLKPFGRLCLIDDPAGFDVVPFKLKSQSVHWELMFTKGLFKRKMETQGRILSEVAELIDQGRVKSTIRLHSHGLTVENLLAAHRLQESGTVIGKTVIEL